MEVQKKILVEFLLKTLLQTLKKALGVQTRTLVQALMTTLRYLKKILMPVKQAVGQEATPITAQLQARPAESARPS